MLHPSDIFSKNVHDLLEYLSGFIFSSKMNIKQSTRKIVRRTNPCMIRLSLKIFVPLLLLFRPSDISSKDTYEFPARTNLYLHRIEPTCKDRIIWKQRERNRSVIASSLTHPGVTLSGEQWEGEWEREREREREKDRGGQRTGGKK